VEGQGREEIQIPYQPRDHRSYEELVEEQHVMLVVEVLE